MTLEETTPEGYNPWETVIREETLEEEYARKYQLDIEKENKLQEHWIRLLEVIIADSTLEEICNFAQRLENIPKYTKLEEYVRYHSRHESIDQKGGFWCAHCESLWELGMIQKIVNDPLCRFLELPLPQKLIQKGSKSWKIEI